ncbi:MAG: HD-GYP domain-containing protein [Phycisphaerales bacterium]|jgi:HD-GYP domain-containing protein (c-di-GMP phosphodiesterase class II)|nr:HD-GYP domain-containing protein [Phycisphaerales bacterium]
MPTPIEIAHLTLRQRCTGLGIPTLAIDGAGALVPGPHATLADRLVSTAAFVDPLLAAASLWAGQPAPGVAELFTGCHAAPIPVEERRRRNGYTVALAFTPAMLSQPAFFEACSAAGVAHQEAHAALAPIATQTPESIAQLRSFLRWMAVDVAQSADQSEAAGVLTSELSASYEQLDAVYDIGRAIGDLTNPPKFVGATCKRLRAALSFDFVAARFADDPAVTPDLRGTTILNGRSPIRDDEDNEELASRSLGVLMRLTPGRDWSIIEPGPDSPLAPASQTLVQPLIREGRVIGAIIAANKTGSDPAISSHDTQLIHAAGGFVNAYLENSALYLEQKQLFMGTIQAVTASIDAKDHYTRGHSERVSHLSELLARALGLPDREVEWVRVSGLVHDVGKIGVPEAVLTKPGRLTDDEFAAIKRHPEIGHNILRAVAPLGPALPGVLSHHERWDGDGYPNGLAGEEIPLIARIIGLADTFDAMSSNRSYRSALTREKVLAEITRCAGQQFDPKLAPLFVRLDFSGFDALIAKHAGDAPSRQAAA